MSTSISPRARTSTADFIEKNPLGELPVLEFDDGTYLTESVAICRYFEGMYPNPPLMGVDPRDIAFVEMWNRRMELEIFGPMANYVQHTHPLFKDRIKQIPEFAEARLDARARSGSNGSTRSWRSGHSSPAIATPSRISPRRSPSTSALNLGGLKLLDSARHLKRWHEAVSSRPSAKA